MSPRRKQQWSSLAILAIGLLVGPVGILAQTLDAVCLSTFNWVRRYALAWVFHSQITVPIARWTIAWACYSIPGRRMQWWRYVEILSRHAMF